MNPNLLILIFGGFLMTYPTRALPLHLQALKIPLTLDRYLRLMPMAALGALIFPGALEALPEAPWGALLAVVAAGSWSWFRGGLILPVALALGVVMLMEYI